MHVAALAWARPLVCAATVYLAAPRQATNAALWLAWPMQPGAWDSSWICAVLIFLIGTVRPVARVAGVRMLSADDLLPRRPRRVLVAGTSGSGKTTLAARIGERLGMRHIEIDALFHGPGWTPRESFEADVDAFIAEPSWVTEWQYSAVRERIAARADLLVWLDLSRATVMRRVVQRTLRRRLRRQILWNGNIEPPLWTVLTDRDHIVRWAWSTHHRTAQRIAAVRSQLPDLVVVRLRDQHGVNRWINGPLAQAATLPPSPD